jgi:hypothetical protein
MTARDALYLCVLGHLLCYTLQLLSEILNSSDAW